MNFTKATVLLITRSTQSEEEVEICRETKAGMLTGIEQVFYQNAYPFTTVVYRLYPLRDLDLFNLAPKCAAATQLRGGESQRDP